MTHGAILLTTRAWSEWGEFTARDGAMAKIAASAAKQKRIIEKTRRSAVGLEDCVFIGWFWSGPDVAGSPVSFRAGDCRDSLLTKFSSRNQSFSPTTLDFAKLASGND